MGELKKRYDNLRLNVITCVNSQNLNEILDLSEFVKNELPVVDGHGPIPMRGDPYDKYLRPPTTEEWDGKGRAGCEHYTLLNAESFLD